MDEVIHENEWLQGLQNMKGELQRQVDEVPTLEKEISQLQDVGAELSKAQERGGELRALEDELEQVMALHPQWGRHHCDCTQRFIFVASIVTHGHGTLNRWF